MIRVLSLGAGVQSTCVLLMSCVGELPKLDAAVFADTQWEPKEVYRHLSWLEYEAKGYGVPVIRGTRGNLRVDAIEFRQTGGKSSGLPGMKRSASVPVFIKNPDGSRGMVNRQCTSEYKIKVVERIIRRDLLGLRPGQCAPKNAVEHWFGISADEYAHRGRKSTNHWETFRYPLVFDVNSARKDELFQNGFTRHDCLDWMEQHGFPRPPRSACIGCPFHSDDEWIDMKMNRPEEFADAVEFDAAMRAASAALIADGMKLKKKLVGLPYLHDSLLPLNQVEFVPKKQGPPSGMLNECRGVCGV